MSEGARDKPAISSLPDYTPAAGADRILEILHQQFGDPSIRAVGHRVVHGGNGFGKPVIIDKAVLAKLRALEPMAPMHQRDSLDLVQVWQQRLDDVPQVACFDTAFHRGQHEIEKRYALPDELFAEGLHRYGFHGLSYESIVAVLQRSHPGIADRPVVIAHLGAGCSMCATRRGKSVSTSMGFSTAEGLPMATRSGSVDPGVLIYLMRHKGLGVDELEDLLYRKSGLLGLSGTSSGMRELRQQSTPASDMTIDYFAHRCVQEIGRLAATLGGLEGLVFTGGIGENDAGIRQQIADRCQWLGVEIDPDENKSSAETISTADSRVRVLVIPADEEGVIAAHTLKLIS